MSTNNYRLYTFVAGLYLSELQKGLQTAHVVGELFADPEMLGCTRDALTAWASEDKTIIICNAGNHQGVKDCWAELERINSALGLPATIFYEDEQSMNGMATACGVIVPEKYYNAKLVPADFANASDASITDRYEYIDAAGYVTMYPVTHAEGQFIRHIKQYRLA